MHRAIETQILSKIKVCLWHMSSNMEDNTVFSPLLYCSLRFMIKRAQGRNRFGMKNFKKRWFRLTNHEFTYHKTKGKAERFLFALFPASVCLCQKQQGGRESAECTWSSNTLYIQHMWGRLSCWTGDTFFFFPPTPQWTKGRRWAAETLNKLQ